MVPTIAVYFLWFYFLHSYYVALGEKREGQNMGDHFQETITLQQTIHEFFVSTSRIAPIGGMIIELTSTLELKVKPHLVCKCKIVVGSGLES